MASTTTTLSFLLLLSLSISSLFIHSVSGYYTIRVLFHSTFDSSAKRLLLSCRESNRVVIVQPLAPNGYYQLFAIDPKSYYCTAQWTEHVAKFLGYSAKERDGTTTKVFWNVDQTGWYLSYDNVTFTKQADWTVGQPKP